MAVPPGGTEPASNPPPRPQPNHATTSSSSASARGGFETVSVPPCRHGVITVQLRQLLIAVPYGAVGFWKHSEMNCDDQSVLQKAGS